MAKTEQDMKLMIPPNLHFSHQYFKLADPERWMGDSVLLKKGDYILDHDSLLHPIDQTIIYKVLRRPRNDRSPLVKVIGSDGMKREFLYFDFADRIPDHYRWIKPITDKEFHTQT